MDALRELIISLNAYLKATTNAPSFWEYFSTTLSPIISTLAVVVGGGFALYKYRSSKNYDINLKILNEVYVPLYNYIVKQETFRFIACPQVSWKEVPILEIRNTKTVQTWNSEGFSTKQETAVVCGCTRDSLLSVCEQANLGLASTELLTLLNMYRVLVHITSGNINSSEKARAVILQEKVEIALRNEILAGYRHYHKKLKLHRRNSDIYSLTDEQIDLLPKISEEEVQKTVTYLNTLE